MSATVDDRSHVDCRVRLTLFVCSTRSGKPLNGRSVVSLAPGVALPPGTAFPCISGGRPRTNEYLFDGISVLQPEPGQVAFLPVVDAIEDFRIETNSPPAEFGRFNGGVVNLTTRSGTNSFHGDAFEFFRHEVLNARNLFAPRTVTKLRLKPPSEDGLVRESSLLGGRCAAAKTASKAAPAKTCLISPEQGFRRCLGDSKPLFRRHQFGGVLGGPIARDRTFFFADYQHSGQDVGRVLISTVPTLLQRQGIFNEPVNGVVPNINDPATTIQLPGAGFQRAPFARNSIPLERMDPVALALLRRYPLPTSPGTANNYRRLDNERDAQNQLDVRLDQSGICPSTGPSARR